jgi:DNA-binding transcriptional LysR family regulator
VASPAGDRFKACREPTEVRLEAKHFIDYRYKMDFADVALFRSIVTAGSLSAAAREMGTTPMLVSRRLAALEAELGARLFHRTTRSLSLTPEGEAFLPHAAALIAARDSAFESVASAGSGLSGVLKVTAPNVIGHAVIVPVVAGLIADNPALRVNLVLSDDRVDIASMGLDVAIRVAPMKPSDMIATRLADNPYILCASPAYIARFGEPATLGDLVSHPCIKLHAMETWPFVRGGELEQIRIAGPLSASTVDAVRAACLAGVGVAMMTYWDVYEQIERGELKRIVLADAAPVELGIWAVFLTRAQMPVRVRAFIDALRKRLLAGTLP